MKKLFVLLAVFMLMGCAFSTEQKVMPFLILEAQKRPENFPGWTDLYMQKCSPDFPLKDAKLICTVRVNGKEVCSDTLMIGTPFTTFWDYSVWGQDIAFGLADKDAKSALIKRVIPWMTERKPMIRQQSRVILRQGGAQGGNGAVEAVLVQGNGVHVALHQDHVWMFGFLGHIQAEKVLPLVENQGLRGI